MEKKIYELPIIKVIKLNDEDQVIKTSGTLGSLNRDYFTDVDPFNK